jgi:hypothetical protein
VIFFPKETSEIPEGRHQIYDWTNFLYFTRRAIGLYYHKMPGGEISITFDFIIFFSLFIFHEFK